MALFWWKTSSVPLRRFLCLPPITHSFQSNGSSRSSGWRTDDELKTLFDEWTIEYERIYTGIEREKKFQNWRESLRQVEHHNNTGSPQWKKGLDLLSDFSEKEINRMLERERCFYLGGLERRRRSKVRRAKQQLQQQQQQHDG